MAHQGCSNLRHGDAKEASGHTGAAVVEAGVPEPGTGDDQGRQFMRDRIRLDRDAPQKKSSEGNAPCNSISTDSDPATRKSPNRLSTTSPHWLRNASRGGRRADRRMRAGRADPRGAAGGLSRRSAPGSSSRSRGRCSSARPTASPAGRWRCSRPSASPTGAEGGVLGQRDDVLEARSNGSRSTSCAAAGSRTSRTGCPRCRT